MWRYLFGLPRARIQWNGTWRSTPSISYRDDTPDSTPPKSTLACLRVQCQGSWEENGKKKWRRDNADYHRFQYCNFNKFGDFIFISSTLICTCHLSQLWKCDQRARERKRRYILLEALRQSNAAYLYPSCNVIASGLVVKHDEDVTRSKPPLHIDAETVQQSPTPEGKKVRFSATVAAIKQDAVHKEEPIKTVLEERPEKYYAEFEESWKDLCDRYDKMKCNRKGVFAAASGDYQQAVSYFEVAGSAGCANALFNLGLMYETDVSSDNNIAEAIRFYEQSVKHGNARAAHNLALIYLNRDLSGDRKLAIALLQQASSLGLTESKTELGVLYTELGKMEEAYQLFEEAAKEENVDATYFLGVCFENGMGVEKNECKAAELYKQASAAGNMQAIDSLAHFFEHGLGGLPVNKKYAVELYEKSAKAGSAQARERLRNPSLASVLTQDDSQRFGCEPDIRMSSSSPALLSSLQNHLLHLSHADWELAAPSLHKSSTHSGAFKAGESANKDVEGSGSDFNIDKSVSYDAENVLFTLGDDESCEDSLGMSSCENTQDSLILDGGFGDCLNLSFISAKNGRIANKKSGATMDRFALDGGFANLQNLSRVETGFRLDKKQSARSLASYSSDSNLSIAFDENCTSASLLAVHGKAVTGFERYSVVTK